MTSLEPDLRDQTAPVLAPGLLSRSTWGLVIGVILGLVAAFGGFVQFLIVALFGGIGLAIGLILDGRLDVGTLLGRVTERR